MKKMTMTKKIRNNSKRDESGFTLVETCIVIIIMSIVLIPLFAYLTMQREQEAARKEQLRTDRIITALAVYVKQNGFYPCPADPTLAQGNPAFGNGTRNPAVGGVCNAANLGGGGGVITGDLPIRDLNLPFRMAANNSGWKYIYGITQNLTQAATFAGGAGNVVINGLPNNAHFIVVNTGRTGKGARNLAGVMTINCNTASADNENCDNNDNVFIESVRNTGTNIDNATFYDDDLAYTLINKDSTMWVMRDTTATAGTMNISNRNINGNIGIGTPSPSARLHVQGGNVRVEGAGGVGGNVDAAGDITAIQNVSAGQNVQATEKMTAPVFYYDTVVPPP